MSDIALHNVLVAVLQEMVSPDVELESRALGKAEPRHHHLEVLQLGGEGLLLALESGHRQRPTCHPVL